MNENGVKVARFWVPLLLTSLLSVAMGAWAIAERNANSRVAAQVKEDAIDIRIARERNLVQDQQLLMITKDMGVIQKQGEETLRLVKKHMGIPE